MGLLNNILTQIEIANNLKTVPHPAELSYEKTQDYTGVAPDESVTDYLDINQVVTAVYRAIFIISSSIAQLPIQVWRKLGDKDPENITDKQDYDIFRTFNEWQTRYDFLELFITYLESIGEAPMLLKRSYGGTIEQMYPILPSTLTVFPHNEYFVDHYEINKGGTKITLDKEDVFLFKYVNPQNPLRGLSPLSAVKNDIIVELHAITSTKGMFIQGMRPSGIVSTDKEVDEATWKRYVKHLRTEYGGSEKAGKIVVMGDGYKFSKVGLSADDMQYIQTRRWTLKTVGMAYGVPPIFLMDFKDSSVLANADIQYKLLWDGLKPKINKLEEVFTQFLLPHITKEKFTYVKFDTSRVPYLQPDKEILRKDYDGGFKTAAISPNDYREFVLALERIDDESMNQHYLPMNMIPINELAPATTPPKSTLFTDNLSAIQTSLSQDSPMQSITKEMLSILKKKKLSDMEVKKIRTLGQLTRLQNKISINFTRNLQNLFKKQEIEILTNLNRNKYLNNKFSSAANFDFKYWVEEFKKAGEPHIAEAIEQAGIQFANDIGSTFTLYDPTIQDYIGTRTENYATIVNSTTKNKIDDLLKQGVEQNLSITQMRETITKYFKTQATFRATRIARTEVVSGTNLGRMQSMKQSDRVKHHMWATQRDEQVRDSHSAVDGVVVKVGESFPVGAGYMGDDRYPSDINERCYTFPTKVDKKKQFKESGTLSEAYKKASQHRTGMLAFNKKKLLTKSQELKYLNTINRQQFWLDEKFFILRGKNLGKMSIVDADSDYSGATVFGNVLLRQQKMYLHNKIKIPGNIMNAEKYMMRRLGKSHHIIGEDNLLYIYRHEMGHEILMSSQHGGEWFGYYALNKDKFKLISKYATSNKDEAFAEVFAVYSSPAFKPGILNKLFNDDNFENLLEKVIMGVE